ncbi:DUF3492 domain-containing protein [Streptomyces sp. NPDC006368]|uniref:DUF3492 domain-containing protein n=1 Tax=Streptomyces sp. NPDC006368 TaxID=3156760 RepID=UPI0033BD06A2
MRIGLLTDGGYPYASGESRVWCDRLVRGLAQHEFHLYALGAPTPRAGRGPALPPQVARVRTAPAREPRDSRPYGRRDRRRFTTHFRQLADAVCGERNEGGGGGDFAAGLYGLADLARERGGLRSALRSEDAVRALESACRAPGARRGPHVATLSDHLALAERLEHALRPLSLPWYGEEDGLGAVDLCHAAAGGRTALPGLLAKRFFGVSLLVTEYGVPLRAHYLAAEGTPAVRALLAAFHRLLAAEVYRQAAVITPGTTHIRRWQEKCGADRAKLRTVHPGMDADRFAAVGERVDAVTTGGDTADARTLVWVGRVEPTKDLVTLLHAFAEVRRARPEARLRLIAAPGRGPASAAYLAHCGALAARLFPDEARFFSQDSGGADGAAAVGRAAVTFEPLGDGGGLAEAYAAGCVTVLSSVVEGFPVGLVEAMLCGRATVSTDVGAVVEVIGGTGLVVAPRDPRALADACLALLGDPERRARLGAAARARALELFTVDQNLAAFRSLYLELLSRAPVRRDAETVDAEGGPLPFAHPAEAFLPGLWTGRGSTPAWAEPAVGAYAGGGRG